MTTPTPGWYPNPDGSGSQRYWDGQAWQQVAAVATPEKPKSKGSGLKVLGILAAVAAGLVFIGSAFGGPDKADATDTPAAQTGSGLPAGIAGMDTKLVNAELLCEEAVTNQLKSPSTADFPEKHNTRQQGQNALGPIVEVRGKVDSQNALGATVRSFFGCTVTPVEYGKFNVTVDELFTP